MPPRQPTYSLYPNLPPFPLAQLSFRISRVLHFGSASSSRQALLCLLPTNQPTRQPRASLMLLLQISGRLLGCLPAGTIGRCVFPSSSRLPPASFFLSLFLPRPISFVSTPLPHLVPPRCLRPIFPFVSPRARAFTFYFTSRSFIIFLISRGYPFVRDNRRKWGGSGRVDGERFFAPRSNMVLSRVKIPYLSRLMYVGIKFICRIMYNNHVC